VASTSFSDYYSLLIVVPEEVESYETVHILNYFRFPFELDEDHINRQLTKKEMGFSKDEPYPCLVIESS